MRRIVCREFGPVDGLSLADESDPEPGPGEVVVAVEAAAVSFVDGLIVEGRYQVRPPLPYTPGSAVAGRVRAIGKDVETVAIGDPVAVLSMAGGGFSTDLVPRLPTLAAAALVPKSHATTALEAAEIVLAG